MALRLRGATSGYIELKAPASAGDNTLTLPTNNGSANQLLKTDGSGNLSWTDDNSGVSLSGSTNNTIATVTGANALAGEANLTFDGTTLKAETGNPVFELSGTTANGGNTFIHINANANHWVLGGDNYTSQNLFVIKDGTPASSTHRFCINNSGNVGIGTVSPGQKLGVSGNIRFEAADPTLEFNNGGAMVYARVANTLQFASGGGPASPTEKARIDSSGRLLIGTTTEGFATYGDKLTIANSGHCGMTIRSGTSSYGTIYFSDGDDGSADEVRGFVDYNHSTNILQLGTDGGSRISISPTGQFNFNYKTNTAPPSPTNGGNEGLQIYATRNDSSNFLGTVDFVANRGSDNTNGGAQMRFFVQNRATGTNPIESLRINRTGNVQIVSEILCIGASTNTGGASSADFGIEFAGNVKNAIKCRNTYGGNGNAAVFITGSTEVGSIVQGNSATTYNTSSDYRLKENAVAISDGITRLKTLKPYRFNWKVDPDTTVDGFFAHEITAVPEAVKGTKDEVASEDIDTLNIKKDDPIYQQIDKSKLVPLITAALKEAIAKIETLETKVAALESA